MATMSSALSSLGKFFSGGASAQLGAAQKLGGAVGRGISSYAGGVSRGASSAAQAGASGLAGLVRGQPSAGAPLGQWTGQTRVVEGAPATQQYTGTAPGQGLFDRGPGRPASYAGLLGGTSGSGGGGGVATGSTQDAFAAMKSEWAALAERNRLAQANQANVSAYNKAFTSANEANEARYQELLGIANATTGQRAKDITSDYAGQQASAMQNLASLGLANTSGASTIRGGFGRKKNEALDRLADQMQQTKLGIIERRTDKIPDLASLVSLGQLGISGLKF